MSRSEIEAAIAAEFTRQNPGIGTVVGVTHQGQRQLFSAVQLTIEAVFEIASITKVFTALLLAELVQQKLVRLSDPLERFLPKFVRPPVHMDGSSLTLEELATHRSGLPRLPSNLDLFDFRPYGPYQSYTPNKLYRYVSGLVVSVGGAYNYSNLGMGLLGHILSRRVLNMSYDRAIFTRICKPLGLWQTGSRVEPLVQGHNGDAEPARSFRWSALAGAGALRSTISDVLSLVEAQLGSAKTTLRAATELVLSIRHSSDNGQIALGWHVDGEGDDEICWHNGATFGFSSFCAFNQSRSLGVAVLRNATTKPDLTEGGVRLLKQLMQSTRVVAQRIGVNATVLKPNFNAMCNGPTGALQGPCD